MAETVVKLRLNQQQLELMDRTIAQGVAPDRVALVRLALREYAAARKAEASRESRAMTARQIISEFVLEPGTGKAIELLKGQILRIEQVEGGQCADFNCLQPA